MPANSIDSDEYIDGSIDRSQHLVADIIDGTKIANDAVDSDATMLLEVLIENILLLILLMELRLLMM